MRAEGVQFRRRLRTVAAMLPVVLLAAPAFAQDKPDPAVSSCTCRAQGRAFALGQSVCLPTAEGPRLAVCDMVLNNTSWRATGQSCPLASGPRRPAG